MLLCHKLWMVFRINWMRARDLTNRFSFANQKAGRQGRCCYFFAFIYSKQKLDTVLEVRFFWPNWPVNNHMLMARSLPSLLVGESLRREELVKITRAQWVAQKRGDWRKKMWRWGGKKGHPRVGQAMWMLEKEGGTWEMTLKKQFFGNFKLLSRLVLDTFVAPTLKGHPHQPTFMPLSIWTSDSNTYWQIELWITGKEYFLEFLTQVLQVLHAIAHTQRNEQLPPS